MLDQLTKYFRGKSKLDDMSQEKINLFNNVKLFESCDENDLIRLAKTSEFCTYDEGELVIQKGGSEQGLYILESGQLDVHLKKDGTSLAVINEHDIVGEMSLIDSEPRSAYVTATQNSRLLFLPRENFFELLNDNPKTGSKILIVLGRILSRRLRKANDRIKNKSQD